MLSSDFLHEKIQRLKKRIELTNLDIPIKYSAADLLPHRPPFLFIDEITHADLDRMIIRGKYKVKSDNPILTGHFPGNPIWPGVLQIEMMAQLGLCLDSLINRKATGSAVSRIGYFTRVHHALFNKMVKSEVELIVCCEIYSVNPLTIIFGGQIYAGSELCSLSIIEAYVDE